MMFMTIDKDGFPTGFYSETIHGARALDDGKANPETLIPADAIEISEEQWNEFISNQGLRRWQHGEVVLFDPPAPAITGHQVNAERQRRVAVGKVIDGVHVTGSDEDARNLMSLALGAQMRLAAGDTETVTTFRDGDNGDHELTPAQLLSLWQQSAAYVSDLYAASWALKAMEPIPADFAANSYWPDH